MIPLFPIDLKQNTKNTSQVHLLISCISSWRATTAWCFLSLHFLLRFSSSCFQQNYSSYSSSLLFFVLLLLHFPFSFFSFFFFSCSFFSCSFFFFLLSFLPSFFPSFFPSFLLLVVLDVVAILLLLWSSLWSSLLLLLLLLLHLSRDSSDVHFSAFPVGGSPKSCNRDSVESASAFCKLSLEFLGTTSQLAKMCVWGKQLTTHAW